MMCVTSYKQSALSLKYTYKWLSTSCEVEKPSGVSSTKWKAWGFPSVSVAATWAFQAGCMFNCGSIHLDQVSSAGKVVEFVGTRRVSFHNKINLMHWCI